MKRNRCRCLLTTVILLLSLSVAQTVYAGDINAEEQMLLDMMHDSIEYKGVIYVAAPGYIEEATAHFCQDDVDLTPEQAEEVIATVFANVKQGIADGYLIPQEQLGSESQGISDVDTSDTGASLQEDTDSVGMSGNVSEQIETEEQQGESLQEETKPGESIIKNTGYDLSGARIFVWVMLIGMGMIMIYIQKYHMLADCDES